MPLLRTCAAIACWLATAFAYVEAIAPQARSVHVARWDKMDHMLAFFTITLLARLGFPRLRVLTLFLLMALFGAIIEISQAVPFIHRDAEWDDWFADVAATLIGLLVAWPIGVVLSRREGRLPR